MNAPISFASAYVQLTQPEKVFCDGYVAAVEREAQRTGERISNALYRPIPGDVIDASRGMMDKPLVRAAIAERINQLAADAELSPAKIIKEYMLIAFSNVQNYMTVEQDGTMRVDFTKCTPEQLAAVQGIDIEETYGRMGLERKTKFKLHGKLEALNKLAAYYGLDKPDSTHFRQETARPVYAALPSDTTAESAADKYSRMING